jgi:tetratricopeptide (TPR) repeat protein
MVIGNLGGLYMAEGNAEQAFTLLREAADAFRDIGDEDRYGRTLMELANLQARSGKWLEAAATYEVALDLVKEPNFRQKVLKGLLGVKNRLTGGGVPKSAGDDSPKPQG